MLLHDVRMTSYCCQQYAECLQFQHDSVPAHRDAHVQQLNCCVKKHQTFLRPTCVLRTAQSGLRIKERKKEVDSFTAGTQTRASRARESSVTRKSAITDHAVKENHVIDWDKAKVVVREAQRQTGWIKEAFWIRKKPKCMNRDAGSYQLSHTWDQVISRSRAPSSCKQSRRDQDVRRTSKRCH